MKSFSPDVISAVLNLEKKDNDALVATSFSTGQSIETGNTTPEQFTAFAKTLIGIPYKFGSTDPAIGFDCSGFINYVSNHFHIKVPRSSIDFTDIGKQVDAGQAKPGDLILFTGTNPNIHSVGHIGIVIDNPGGQLSFIHSSSGKANGVTVTDLNDYYLSRLVKVIRVFPDTINNA